MPKYPLLSDEDFYKSLSDDLKSVKSVAEKGDFESAKSLFATYVRTSLDKSRFFSIPYEEPENIFRLPGESDSEACKRIEEYKVVSVGVLGDFSSTRHIDWYSNPTPNGYREWTWQLSRHNDIKMMAHEYQLTRDEEIAKVALDIMASWLHECPVPPKGTIGYETHCWRTIECGIRMGANWPYILHSFIDSPYFTDELILDWYKSVYEHARRLKNERTRSNWLIMEMNGLAHIGMLYPCFSEADVWFSDAVSTLEGELDKQFYADGFQYELTTNYHDVVVNNYQRLFETARAYERPLPDSLREKLVKACTVNVKIMMPDGTVPDINDGRRVSVRELLEPRARFFSDPSIDFILKGGAEPDYRSILLPYSGFAVFRTGWSEDDTYGFLDAGPFGRAHQHEDKLNFLMYANRKLLVCEGGIYAYDTSPMRAYFVSTRAHNTIRVDGHDQDRRSTYRWADEDIEKSAGIKTNIPCEDIEWAEGVYEEGYAGISDKVIHKRRVVFVKKYHLFAVLDQLEAKEEHEYEAIYHIDDEIAKGTDFSLIRVFTDPSATLSIVSGQMEGEIQGFVSLSQKQGDVKAVNTLLIKKRAVSTSLITIFQAKKETVPSLEEWKLEKGSLELRFTDGTVTRVSIN